MNGIRTPSLRGWLDIGTKPLRHKTQFDRKMLQANKLKEPLQTVIAESGFGSGGKPGRYLGQVDAPDAGQQDDQASQRLEPQLAQGGMCA